ncbi:MAG: hypothetical protein ACOZEN_06210 [Thermodesulfobacteriota bacterium]
MRSPHVVYLSVFVPLTAVVFALLGGFNLLVDPYGIFGTPVVKGFNDGKNGRGHISEPYWMIRDRFTDLVVGSSRVQGVSCEDMAGFLEDGAACKVAPVPHANASWLIKEVYHSLAVSPVKRVYFGLDFFGFNMSHTPFQASDDERLLGVPGKSDLTIINDLFRQLFSPAATMLSIDTMAQSARNAGKGEGGGLAPESRAEGAGNPAAHLESLAARESLFLRFYPGILKYYSGYGYKLPGKNVTVLDELRALLGYCRDKRVEVRFFINPFHSIMLDIFQEHGLMDRYIAWKDDLARIVDDANAGLPRPLFHLWDFSGYNEITTEPVLEQGTIRTRLAYYSDPFHYTRTTGRKVLEIMHKGPPPGGDFGIRLNGAASRMAEELLEAQKRRYPDANRDYAAKLFNREETVGSASR